VKAHDPRPLFEPYRNPHNPAFYYFEELNPNPNTSVHVATITVNKRTGEVWDVEGSVCWLLLRSSASRPKPVPPKECEEISN
jgi:hypothetical protein